LRHIGRVKARGPLGAQPRGHRAGAAAQIFDIHAEALFEGFRQHAPHLLVSRAYDNDLAFLSGGRGQFIP